MDGEESVLRILEASTDAHLRRSMRPDGAWASSHCKRCAAECRQTCRLPVTVEPLSLRVFRFVETGDPPVRHRCAHPPRDRPPRSRHRFPQGVGAQAQRMTCVAAASSHRARKGLARTVCSQGARVSCPTDVHRVIRAMAAPAANARNTDVSGFARTVLRSPCVHSSPSSCMR